MLIDTEDGRCRACDGQLEIVNADDNALHVECLACGQAQSAEPGTFGDEALSYYYGFAAGREHPAEPQTTGSSGGTRAIDQLCKELADLRQIVAAFMLLVLEGADDLAVEIHDAVYAWANQEFDPEILKESLAETLCSTAGGIEKRPAAQKGLFSTDEPEAADGD